MWHGALWLIDHGAALYFHHQWDGAEARSRNPFPLIKDHVLLPFATTLPAVDADMAARLGTAVIDTVIDAVPDAWLAPEPGLPDAAAVRAAYRRHFAQRLQAPRTFAEDAERAHRASV